MSPVWIAALAALAAAAVAWRMRHLAVARRRVCRERFAALLQELRPALSLVEAEPRRWRLERHGRELASVDAKALTAAAAGSEERRRRLFLAVADAAARGPRPWAGEFDLKSHGRRTLPRLADEGLGLLALEPMPVRFTAAEPGDLPTIYLIDGEPEPVYVTDEHLADAGIDTRDLHGVALAVLRQRFDESEVRSALIGRVVRIAPADGCGGSRLLLLPEALGDDEALYASAPAPDLLLVAFDRGTLDQALAGPEEPAQPLPPRVFRVTADGLRMES
ncbi:MAG: hypothetical protein ACE5EG_10630 [Thermoanaerobaculia bacterium]